MNAFLKDRINLYLLFSPIAIACTEESFAYITPYYGTSSLCLILTLFEVLLFCTWE